MVGISVEFPTKYNRRYIKNNIGSFYGTFSKKKVPLKKVINVLYDYEKIIYFVKPWIDMDKRRGNGSTIVLNLKGRLQEIT